MVSLVCTQQEVDTLKLWLIVFSGVLCTALGSFRRVMKLEAHTKLSYSLSIPTFYISASGYTGQMSSVQTVKVPANGILCTGSRLHRPIPAVKRVTGIERLDCTCSEYGGMTARMQRRAPDDCIQQLAEIRASRCGNCADHETLNTCTQVI